MKESIKIAIDLMGGERAGERGAERATAHGGEG